MKKFLNLRLSQFIPVGLIALAAAAVLLAPEPANATTITYTFTVNVTSGPLSGASDHGSFSYDSSSIVPSGANLNTGLLSALNFTFDGIKYNASTANTGWLGFDSAGDLTSFAFGTNCHPGSCTDTGFGDNVRWLMGYLQYQDLAAFGYSISNEFYGGNFTLARVSVPEPSALGMFGLGLLLMGGFMGLHRRVA